MSFEENAACTGGIDSRLKTWRMQESKAEPCFNCGALEAFGELLDDAEEMRDMLLEWQDWWNRVGCEMYITHGAIQSNKPPFMISGNKSHGKHIQVKDEEHELGPK
jgi:hypothetical protein